MTRRLLAMTMALGLVVTAIGSTGIFAVLSDRARTGDFHVDTGVRPVAVDVQLATSGSIGACDGPYSDDIEGLQFELHNTQPDTSSGRGYCVKNAGASPVEIHMLATDMTDVDTECTNDEADFGDETCGSDQAGELAGVIEARVFFVDCNSPFTGSPDASPTIADLVAYVPQAGVFEDWDPGVLQPDEVACVFLNITYPGIGQGTTEEEAQLAQSDTLEWRFAFDATLP